MRERGEERERERRLERERLRGERENKKREHQRGQKENDSVSGDRKGRVVGREGRWEESHLEVHPDLVRGLRDALSREPIGQSGEGVQL